MYFIKNIKKQKFVFINENKSISYLDNKMLATNYNSVQLAKEDIKNFLSDKKSHIVVDKYGFPS